MNNFTFEELEIIGAVSGNREEVISRLSELLAVTEDEYGILEVISSAVDKLKAMTDADFAALDLTETEGYYAE